MTNDCLTRLHSQQFYRYCLDKTGNEEDYSGQQLVIEIEEPMR